MTNLSFAPKIILKEGAWSAFGKITTAFLNTNWPYSIPIITLIKPNAFDLVIWISYEFHYLNASESQ